MATSLNAQRHSFIQDGFKKGNATMRFFVASVRPLQSHFHALRLFLLVLVIMKILLPSDGRTPGIVLCAKRNCEVGDYSQRSDCLFVSQLCPLCFDGNERMLCYRSATSCFGNDSRPSKFHSLSRSLRSSLSHRCSPNQYTERVSVTVCAGLRAILNCKEPEPYTILNRAAIYEFGEKTFSYPKLSVKSSRKRETIYQYRLHISCRAKDIRRQEQGMQDLHVASLLPSISSSTDELASQPRSSEIKSTLQQYLHTKASDALAIFLYIMSVTWTTSNIVTKRFLLHFPDLVKKIVRREIPGCLSCSGVSGPYREPLPEEGNIQNTSSARRRIIQDAFKHLIKSHPKLLTTFNVTSCRWKQTNQISNYISCRCKSEYLLHPDLRFLTFKHSH